MEGNHVTTPAQRRTAVVAGIGLTLVYILIVVQTMMAQGGGPSESTGLLAQGEGRSYMPIVFKPLLPLVLTLISLPNAGNEWFVAWNSGGTGSIQYELQEANDPNFTTNVMTYNAGTATGYLVNTHVPSLNNVYYYRVRAIINGVVG